MKNKLALSSLAMDLRRVALGYHRGATRMADRFYQEALIRRKEIDTGSVKPYVLKLLDKFDQFNALDTDRRAEDILTYSILFQNAAVHTD